MKFYNCVCCGRFIAPAIDEIEDRGHLGCYIDGVVDKITANYGSKHDGDSFILAICDECIVKNVESGSMKLIKDKKFCGFDF